MNSKTSQGWCTFSKACYCSTVAAFLHKLAYYYPNHSLQAIIPTGLRSIIMKSHLHHFYIKTYRRAALHGVAGFKTKIGINDTHALTENIILPNLLPKTLTLTLLCV